MKGSLKYLVKQVLLFFACFDINKYELDNEAYHELWAYVFKKLGDFVWPDSCFHRPCYICIVLFPVTNV